PPRGWKLWVTNNRMFAAAAAKLVESRLRKRTRGHYPAVFKALEVVSKGISRPLPESLALEREAILELAQTRECHNLVRIFFLQEHAKKRSYLAGDAGAS